MNKYRFCCDFRVLSNVVKLKNTNKTVGAVFFAAWRCTCFLCQHIHLFLVSNLHFLHFHFCYIAGNTSLEEASLSTLQDTEPLLKVQLAADMVDEVTN